MPYRLAIAHYSVYLQRLALTVVLIAGCGVNYTHIVAFSQELFLFFLTFSKWKPCGTKSF